MEVRQATLEYRLQQWAEILKTCKGSGKTVKTFCEENNINEKSYYYWQRRLRETLLNKREETTLVSASTRIEPVFAEIGMGKISNNEAGAIVVHISGTTVEIPQNAEQCAIEAVLRVVKALC